VIVDSPIISCQRETKTHLSIALGLEAIYAGFKVCFERTTNLVKLLKSAEVQRTSALRLNRILKSHVLIIDEIGYTPIERRDANFFFNLVSEIYERSFTVITSKTSFNDWAELLGAELLPTALLDRLLHQAHTFSLSGESFRIKKRKEE
jgi:DNA replication protein DnaC